jgi:D-3-phosphoglycerate dehydrogenase/(S)-sulfolactate dehydrogenase
MGDNTSKIVVGLGLIAAEIVEPILGSQFKYIQDPKPEDLALAQGALVRAAFNFNKSVFDSMPNLKVIARTGVGTELVDLAEADARNIPVVITPGSNTNAVAEGAFAHILHLVKRLGPFTKLVAQDRWDERTNYPVSDLAGATLGVIGYGRIGSRIAQIAEAFDMKVIAFDPYAQIPEQIKAGSLEELLKKSDVITLHLPLTPETTGLLNSKTFKSIKDGAILVNCSRGALIDLDAAYSALQSSKLAGLGLDVFDPEPPISHPIFNHENVVLTPHMMGLSNQATIATYQMAAQGVRDVLTGSKPQATAN